MGVECGGVSLDMSVILSKSSRSSGHFGVLLPVVLGGGGSTG